MINFIIYDKDKRFRQMYISIILKMFGNKNISYEIVEIEKYNNKTLEIINNLCGKKIFILEIDVPGMSGLDLAKIIRNNGDWDSQIIISTEHEKLEYCALTSNLLILDYISKYYNCLENVRNSIGLALKILNKNKSLNFQYKGEIFQLPYKDILFIERNIDLDISIINTKDSKIEINKTINELELLLKDENNFLKTHRSCIVNINNITSFILEDSIIKFDKKSTNLITRDKKKELKDRLLSEKTINV